MRTLLPSNPTSRRSTLVGCLFALVLASFATACTTTKAHQRGTLAKPVMALDPDGDRFALRRHVLSTREGAVGGFGGGGGGCGCN